MATSAFQQLKLDIVAATGVSKDMLHIHVGLVVFLFVLVVGKKPIGSVMPLAVVLVAAFLGEAMDMRDDLASMGEWRWASSARDIILTVLWPTVMTFFARWGVLKAVN